MANTEYGSMPAVQPDDVPKRANSHWEVNDENSHEKLYGIAPANVHNNFVRKVYGLLALELLVTAGISAVMMLVPSIRNGIIDFVANHPTLFQIVLLTGVIGSCCFLMCVAKQYPLNMVALAVFVTFMSIDVGFVCAVYYAAGMGKLILISILITAGIFLGLSTYAWLSARDFSYMGGFLYACLCGLLLLGIVQIFVHIEWLQILYCCFGILIFSGYIIFDTYMIKKKLGPDDALLASIQLYLDIINLFIMILQLLGSRS